MDLEYSWMKKKILAITGLDLDSYRPDQMKRLIDKAIEKSGARNYVQFVKDLEANPDKVQAFRDSVTINVSSLFRDAVRWRELEKTYSDYLRERASEEGGSARGEMAVKIWSAGCSIGAEPYTLAIISEKMIADEEQPNFKYNILATDMDNSMLERGRLGIYTDKETKEVPVSLIKEYMEVVENPQTDWSKNSTAKRFYRADSKLRSRIVFKNHNLLKDQWDGNYDMIVCRNVMIYFTNDIKDKLFRNFSVSLRTGGILFIGGTEVIFKPGEYGLKNERAGIYRKASEPAGGGT